MTGRKGMMIGWKRDRKEIPEKEEELLSPIKSEGRNAFLIISTSLL
jgi:hypothetical protein